jgi:hypothetical protein
VSNETAGELQPTDALAGKRSRRVGIVAVARKLCVLLWRYVTQGVVPDGVATKAADRRTQPRVRRIAPKRRAANVNAPHQPTRLRVSVSPRDTDWTSG